jgi:hypothetical protein
MRRNTVFSPASLPTSPPYYNSIGYDIVCTAQGPIILEINTGASVCISQMRREWGIADAFVKS